MEAKKISYGSGTLVYIALCFLIFGANNQCLSNPVLVPGETDDKKGKAAEIIDKMVAAHGGLEKWLQAPSFTFTHIGHMFTLPVKEGRSYYDNWRYYRVTIEPRTSRGYVVLPLENDARIAISERKIWSQGYDQSEKYKSSPLVVTYYQYSFLNLPWLTQMPGVDLEYLGREKLPQNATSYHTIKMTFTPESGNEHRGYYILYIDPDSFLLKATKHTALFPILPGGAMDVDVPVFPDSYYRVFDNYFSSAGLLVPTSYESYSEDGERLLSIHLIINPSFEKPFDEGMLKELENTVVRY